METLQTMIPKYLTACELGCLLVNAGIRLICGGLGGIMEAGLVVPTISPSIVKEIRLVCSLVLICIRQTDGSILQSQPDWIICATGWLPMRTVSSRLEVVLAHCPRLLSLGWCEILVISSDCEGWSGKLSGTALDTPNVKRGTPLVVLSLRLHQLAPLSQSRWRDWVPPHGARGIK